MNKVDILAKFLELYPYYHDKIHQYAPESRNTIKIWFKDGRTFDFTYSGNQNCRLINNRDVVNNYSGRYL